MPVVSGRKQVWFFFPYTRSLRNLRWFSIMDEQLHNWMKYTGDRIKPGRRGKALRRLLSFVTELDEAGPYTDRTLERLHHGAPKGQDVARRALKLSGKRTGIADVRHLYVGIVIVFTYRSFCCSAKNVPGVKSIDLALFYVIRH
ncbi:hypothetical protein PDENDC454_16218 [Paenibacillus dendritiformis C454]|uniref:Uncharacterized protein n=1 Tax=Paenibacillus dendritiformis C454 TaxID=1131935 RepID=H3SI75_9BACL|nr:hypothetical protein PDENDC454_16218 [Paenibacillus dendritiformis C454]